MDNKRTHSLQCNCRTKEDCPMGRRRKSENVVYQSNIFPMENSNDVKVYIGISTGNWKQGSYNHRHSFTYQLLKNQTALLKWFWNLREHRLAPQIKWKFIKKFSMANRFNSRCNLCLEEKECIIKYKATRQ